MNRILKDQEGSAALQGIIVLLVLLLIFSVISEYLRLQIIAKGIRDAVQSSVISVATQNYDKVYNSLREGYSGGYMLSEEGWISHMDEGDVMGELTQLLGLEGGRKHVGGIVEYELSDLAVNILNAPFAPASNNQRFETEAWITLTVPLSFGWEHVPPMRIRLKVNAGYTPKF
jgi:hypothetical protein